MPLQAKSTSRVPVIQKPLGGRTSYRDGGDRPGVEKWKRHYPTASRQPNREIACIVTRERLNVREVQARTFFSTELLVECPRELCWASNRDDNCSVIESGVWYRVLGGLDFIMLVLS